MINKKGLLGWSTGAVALVILVLLFMMVYNLPAKVTHKYILPAGFTGWVEVVYEQREYPALTMEGHYFIYEVPPSGKVQTSSRNYSGPIVLYYAEADGKQTRLPTNEIMIHGLVTSSASIGHSDGTVEEIPETLRFFVGTEEQYLADSSYDGEEESSNELTMDEPNLYEGVIESQIYNILVDEYLKIDDPQNPHTNSLYREYKVFDGVVNKGISQHVDTVTLPKEIVTIPQAKQFILSMDLDYLKLKPLTIVSEKVLHQWASDGNDGENEYWSGSPKGLTLEQIKNLDPAQEDSSSSSVSVTP